jgi:hypothetical protein
MPDHFFVYKLPRQIESEYPGNNLLAVLQSRTRKLWDCGKLDVPVLDFSAPLKNALIAARHSGRILRGLEAATATLDQEGRGIDMLNQLAPQGQRVSRLVLLAGDGSNNFYRTVDRLLEKHAPRVLGCVVEADSFSLGSLLFGPEKIAKLVLVSHKDDVSRLLRALMPSADA